MLADLAIGVQPVNVLADKRVVIVEDARSLILGGLAAGAGAVAAKRFRCGVVDPRPFAVGAIATALRDHPHIGAVIPSLGRTPAEIDDLAASVYATPGDAVLWASNADPAFVIPDEKRPIVRAFGELTEVAGPPLQEVLVAAAAGPRLSATIKVGNDITDGDTYLVRSLDEDVRRLRWVRPRCAHPDRRRRPALPAVPAPSTLLSCAPRA